MPIGAAPSQREEAVNPLLELGRGAIADRGQVGDQPDVPKQRRDRAVDADREDVPQERAPEVRPHPHLVRDREHKVGDPNPSDVEPREDQRTHDGKDRHRLGRAIDRGPPLLPEEEEDRGDQGSCVADAHPEYEVRDVPRPADRDVESPDPDAFPKEPGHGDTEQPEQAQGREEDEPPGQRGLPFEGAGHDLCNRMKIMPPQD